MIRGSSAGSIVVWLALLSVGCTGNSSKDWGGSPGGKSGNNGDDTNTTNPDDTNTHVETACDDTFCETGIIETGCPDSFCDTGGDSTDYDFDEPGDYLELAQSEEQAYLGDESGDSNTDQQFYMVVVNTTEDQVGFRLMYSSGPPDEEEQEEESGDTGGGGGGGGGGNGGGGNGPPPSSNATNSPFPGRHGVPEHRLDEHSGPVAPPLDSTDIGVAFDEFLVRDDAEDEESYHPVTAHLWGVGEYVGIWVDDQVPIDWDYECDDEVDVYDASTSPCNDGYDNDGDGDTDSDDEDCGTTGWSESSSGGTGPRNSFGLNNCDLATIASIVDGNIVVNFTDLFGETSDVNEDGKITVLITPLLNALPLTSSDEDDHYRTIGSYAAPWVDLASFDDDSNPGSDEQEIIYVRAPDPVGFYNPNSTTTVEEYTSQELLGQIASSYIQLIIYNQKVLVNESSMEEAWLMKTLSAVGTDIVGFGALFYQQAWTYLDAPYLYNLTDGSESEEAPGMLESSDIGANYLFGRWLVDAYGAGILATMTQSDLTGTDVVVEATGAEVFEDVVLAWQVALLTTGVLNDSGSELVDSGTWLPYAAASTISAPTEAPSPPTAGVYYGSNGYQTGFNLRGTNRWMEGGTTDSPTENEGRRTIAAGPDHHTYTPGYAYYGLAAENYGASIARLTELPYDDATVTINGCGGECVGIVVRWPDVSVPDTAIETIFSPLDANALALPTLPDDGTPIYAIGDISNSSSITVASSDVTSGSSSDVYDLDRWLLDLTNRTEGEAIQVAIWLDRRFEGTEGEVAPYNPWIAIAPKDDVPTPVYGTHQSDATCTDGTTWAYPTSMLSYLIDQTLLSQSAYSDDDDSMEPCGVASSTALTCESDWDSDGVADGSEPSPSTFIQQVWVQQCANNGGSWPPETPYSSVFIDQDETDEDDQFSFSAIYNVGGQSGEEGEEALLYATLEGGQEYLLVVSGGDDTGTYELTMRQLN